MHTLYEQGKIIDTDLSSRKLSVYVVHITMINVLWTLWGIISPKLEEVDIQCVSLDSTSFVIYPELEATEVWFWALKRCLCGFYFRIDNETGGIQWNTLYLKNGFFLIKCPTTKTSNLYHYSWTLVFFTSSDNCLSVRTVVILQPTTSLMSCVL